MGYTLDGHAGAASTAASADVWSFAYNIFRQRHALTQWPVVVAGAEAQLTAVITDLDRCIVVVEGEIATALAASEWAASLGYLTSAPGIGLLTAAWLLVATVNFTLGENARSGGRVRGIGTGAPPVGHEHPGCGADRSQWQ